MPNVTERLSIVASAVANDPRHAPARSRELGFTGLLFDAYASSLNIPELSASGRREFRHVLSAQDQQLVGLRWETGPKGFGPGADVDQALTRLDRVMEAAAGLVSPLVLVDLGPLPEPPPTPRPVPKITPEQAGLILLPTAADVAAARQPEPPTSTHRSVDPSFVSQVGGALTELGRRADRYGVTIAFRSELASFSAVECILQTVNCPWFGVDLDPVAVLRDEWDLDEVFSRLGSFFRHVRARDAVRGADRRTKPAVVGQGSVNWTQLLSNLEGAGYGGWITVDPTELPDRLAAAAVARRHISTQDL
jgi:sugar phosphate isomerase/epimerase